MAQGLPLTQGPVKGHQSQLQTVLVTSSCIMNYPKIYWHTATNFKTLTVPVAQPGHNLTGSSPSESLSGCNQGDGPTPPQTCDTGPAGAGSTSKLAEWLSTGLSSSKAVGVRTSVPCYVGLYRVAAPSSKPARKGVSI